MATTQLSLFNDALGLLGLRSLATTSDNTESARVLNALWDHTRIYCLEQARWRFAERQATLSPGATSEVAYNLTNAFAKPSDFVKLRAVGSDITLDTPVDDWHERGSFWYSESGTVYISYTSKDSAFGYDLTLWPESFVLFYVHYLALRAAPRLAPSLLGGVPVKDSEGRTLPPQSKLEAGMVAALEQAKEFDLIEGPSQFLPDGATSQLSVFNHALWLMGKQQLVKVTDATKEARTLLNLWDHARDYILQQHRWKFAERQATVSPGATSELAYGLTNAFPKPADFVTLNAIASDATFDTAVDDLHERGDFWYSNSGTIYIQYVSNDVNFGYDTALWDENFTLALTYYLAATAAPSLGVVVTDEAGRASAPPDLKEGMVQALARAVQYDEVEGPSLFLPGGVTTQLSIFNQAMWALGLPNLKKVTDAGHPARTMLNLWARVRDYCLGQGHWKFAEDEVKLTPSVTEVPTFGLTNAFEKPSDFIRVNEIASDEYFIAPIFAIHDRGDFWYCDLDEIYVRYVSKGATKGYDLTRWPETFALYVALHLATLAAPLIAPDRKIELITAPGNVGLDEAKKNALSKDAVEGPTKFLPEGRWTLSRNGRTNKGRNSRASLYGT